MKKRSYHFYFLLILALFGIHLYLQNQDARRIEEWKRQHAEKTTATQTPPSGETINNGKEERLDEMFYVLQTPYQQLVFSNYGASLAEINLPFRSTEKESVVLPIEFDREMEEDHQKNAIFPLLSYELPGSKDLHIGHAGGYYPLLRRSQITKDDSVKKIDPKYYSLNIISETEDLSNLRYKVTHFDSESITFEATQGKHRIIKTYKVITVAGAPYCFDLILEITGDTRGLWLTSGVPEVEWISGGPAPSLKYRVTKGEKQQVDPIELPEKSSTFSLIRPDWISNSNGFFSIIIDPITKVSNGLKVINVPAKDVPSRLTIIDPVRFPASSLPGYEMMLPLEEGKHQYRIFAGPLSSAILDRVDAVYSDKETGYNPDYRSSQTYHGWFTWISQPFTKLLFLIMQGFYFVTRSWGISIILLTIVVRMAFYPLKVRSTQSLMKMQAIAPQLKAIQTRYKADPDKVKAETLKLYQEKGANPISGCLPQLIQIPFYFWMYDVLKSTFELRGACFIPGWITDLAAPDVFLELPFRIPFIGTELHLLPILAGVLMLGSMKLMSATTQMQPQDPDKTREQRTANTIMTVMFTVFFYHMPSGLNIYLMASTACDSAQQWWIVRKLKNMG